MKSAVLIFLFLLSGLFISSNVTADDSENESTPEKSVSVISIDGAIGPTTTNYIQRGLKIAREREDQALVIELDTPGGLLTSTQDIVQIMLGSEFPIVVYVSPEGASAGSAGTFITLAAHIAAMAPATTIGAASPVSMGGGEMDTVSQKKIFNFSESFIESIAERRDRNTEWAKSAVTEGAAITAREALELNVIDLIADNLPDLLTQMDGLEINEKPLETSEATVNRIDNNLAEIFLGFIIRPEVMLILTLISIYGILGEVTNPGAIIPGMSGVIALILLLYGVAAMPINTAGFLLIGLAIILFITEAFTPTYGILLTGGGISFFIGALMLFQDMPEGMQLSMYWLIPATILTVLVFAWIISYGIRAQYGAHRSGLESHIGQIVEVSDDIDSTTGRIFFAGEFWTATSDSNIKAGEKCKIVSFDGLKVNVKPLSQTQE